MRTFRLLVGAAVVCAALLSSEGTAEAQNLPASFCDLFAAHYLARVPTEADMRLCLDEVNTRRPDVKRLLETMAKWRNADKDFVTRLAQAGNHAPPRQPAE